VSDEDATRIATSPPASRACRARGIWRTTRHTDKRAALYATADRRPTSQVNAWQTKREVARHARYPRIASFLARMSRVSGMSATMSRGCDEETASVKFKPKRTVAVLRTAVRPISCEGCQIFLKSGHRLRAKISPKSLNSQSSFVSTKHIQQEGLTA